MNRQILRALGALLVAAGIAGCDSVTGIHLPSSIHSCETNTATLCADWQRSGTIYVADWAQGSHAEIHVTQFDDEHVIFVRDDPSGTSMGMHAVYEGTPSGHSITNGLVTWTQNGQTFSGTWTATW